jgi:DNA (cytosine-5)-methyltransferase 1
MIAPRDSFKKIHFAEFFAGIGLVRIGLERASSGFECVFANDLDVTKRQMYAHHFHSSIDEINGEDVHELCGDEVPDISLATASFPCTDLSLAGGRAGVHSGESSAFWGFHRVLKEMGNRRPSVVLLENVVGLLSSNDGQDFEDVLLAMNKLGYAVDPLILDARWFVPQSRARMFVICVQKEIVPGHFSQVPVESRIRPARLTKFISARADSVDWWIRDYPDPPIHSIHQLQDIIIDPEDESSDWWSRERVDYILNQMFDRHLVWIDAHMNDSDYSYATAFRRVRPVGGGVKRSMAELRTDGIAGCLRTPKGGSGRQILVRAGKGKIDVRLLSPAECASLMGAKGFRVSGTLNQALFGFGDAVCVDAVSWIAENAIVPALISANSSLCGYAVSNG